MIGIGLELHLDMNKFKTAFRYLGVRYCFSFIFAILIAFLTPFSQQIKTVLCMLFFSPIAAMTAGFTSDVQGDVETSAFMTSLSIIVGIIVMPLLLMIMG
jgi:predicted Na+-dependent transporter